MLTRFLKQIQLFPSLVANDAGKPAEESSSAIVDPKCDKKNGDVGESKKKPPPPPPSEKEHAVTKSTEEKQAIAAKVKMKSD